MLDAIRAEGLKPGTRRFVHLGANAETACAVGRRCGRPVVLTIDTAVLYAAGHTFHRAENGVWLTLAVPPGFIIEWGEGDTRWQGT